MHARFGDLTNVTEAEHLEAAGVSEDRSLPVHEIVQVTVQFHDLLARAQPQVEGITEQDLRTGVFSLLPASCPLRCRRCPQA